MSKKTCKWTPEVITPKGVRASRLFLDLVDKKKLHYSRDLALTIYANYLNSNIEEQMEVVKKEDGSPKYVKNRQGQFNAKDVVEFLDIEKQLEEVNNLTDEELRIGAVESKGGSRIDYTDAEEVLNKVNTFNKSHKGLVADINTHYSSEGSPLYNIVIYEKNSKTISFPVRIQERLQAWDVYKQVFNSAGVDITNVPASLKNVFNADNIGLCNHLKNLALLSIDNMYKKDAMTLLYVDKDSKYTKRLIDAFGSIGEAAQVLDDWNHGNKYASKEERHLISMAINHAKKLHGLDIKALIDQINKLQSGIRNESQEIKIQQKIHELDKKYNVGINEISDFKNKIHSLSDANKAAITQLKRKFSEIRKEKGITKEGRELESLYNKLKNELKIKHYYNGIIDYLKIAGTEIASINDLLKNISQSGEVGERITKNATILRTAKLIKEQYYDIVKALASDTTTMNEVESQADIDNIKQQARELLKLLDGKDSEINEFTEDLVKDCLRSQSNGNISESEINDMLKNAIKDVGWVDQLLYSLGTSNNVIAAVTGRIIRNAQTNRTTELEALKRKVSNATTKLYKAGYNSKFMYENQKRIVSDIDWEMYDSVKKSKENSLRKQGLRDFDLQEAMEEWEVRNTEDRLVDKVNNRYERVPGKIFRKKEDFQKDWSPEQKEYYEVMMEYKGEIESNYPSYAQNYYLPPQVRRNFTDAIVDGNWTGEPQKSLKEVEKAFINRLKEPFTVREDDTNYAENGIVEGENVRFVEGNYDSTPKKEIPIYFQKSVEEGELMLDFSAAILHEAGSSYNYKAMNEIKDTVETIRDYVDLKMPIDPNSRAELIINNKMMRMTQRLFKWGKRNNVSSMMNGFIDQEVYGIKRSSFDTNHKWITKLVDTTIAYTSFKGLAFNLPGATSNALMGIQQIFIDTCSGEFFNYKDVGQAFLQVLGKAGIPGEVMDIVSNNVNSKAKLLQDMFDPQQENYEGVRNKRYYHTMFRHIISKDIRYIGYGVGEHLIHLVPMYAILNHEKVRLNGEKISLYDAFEIKRNEYNSELIIKDGVTDLDGNPITENFIEKIKGRIRYVNQSMHGAMNAEDKGLIHQYMLGRLAANFHQWMIAHYSRRVRERHFDDALGDWREGYYRSVWNFLLNDDVKDTWKAGYKGESIWLFVKDLFAFAFRSSTQWNNLDDMQKYNVKRARAEIYMLIALMGLSCVLGEPDDHKKEFWRRWWIYQTKRMITETESSTPVPQVIGSTFKILQSPMAGINTLNSLLYFIYGIGDITETVETGPHKGENKYLRNLIKYDLPFFKDWERLQSLDEDDSLFKTFDYSPSNH